MPETEIRYQFNQPAVVAGAFDSEVVAIHVERIDAPATLPLSTWVSRPRGQRPSHTFETPVLNEFTDMQERLLLDPIHEVDHAGWPHRKVA
ncbi:MAG: hypothetical protein KF832_23935 [Caldilineaceae bacterium]|nr:hypothetical protein [Caldilineaceae bacterium]